MLPLFNRSSLDDHHTYKKPKTPPDIVSPKKSHFLSSISFHARCSWLILSLLLIQLLFLSCFHHLSPFFLSRPVYATPPIPSSLVLALLPTPLPEPNNDVALLSTPLPQPNNDDDRNSECSLGRFYIYDLPKEFNSDIYKQCDKFMTRWGSRCEAFSNNGFGPKAIGIQSVVPKNLSDLWYWSDQFAPEIIFHNRLLHHKCRTLDSKSATAYYMPFYAGLESEKYLWSQVSIKKRDHLCTKMIQWVRGNHPHFNRSGGWDHFLAMGHVTWDFRRLTDLNSDWGSKCLLMPSMQNVTRLLNERSPWDSFDLGIPFPTNFHPNTDADVVTWQNYVLSRKRHALFCFIGATRNFVKRDFRGILMSQCQSAGEACRVVDCAKTSCSNGANVILETFLHSDFCLQPRGDSMTRKSVFDCMIAGSIPVFFWKRTAYIQYEWFLPGEPESYSVFIHRDEVKNGTSIQAVLEKFSKDEVNKMREKVVEYIPRLMYSKRNKGLESIKDAVDVAVDAVLRRIKQHMENDDN